VKPNIGMHCALVGIVAALSSAFQSMCVSIYICSHTHIHHIYSITTSPHAHATQRRNVQSASAKWIHPSIVQDWAGSRSAWLWPEGLWLGPTHTPTNRAPAAGGRDKEEETLAHVRHRPRLGPYTPYSQPRGGDVAT
jgi:hypothetical protein